MKTDLRYPIGRFERSARFANETRAAAIRAIADHPKRFRNAVHGLTDAQLDTRYRPDGWTVRQVVHHVADSHMNAYVRTRLALTEDNPTVKPYDEAKWAELADAKSMPIDVSLALVESIHARWVTLISSLVPAQFSRTMNHPEQGQVILDGLFELYAWHGKHHSAHITELRKRSGW